MPSPFAISGIRVAWQKWAVVRLANIFGRLQLTNPFGMVCVLINWQNDTKLPNSQILHSKKGMINPWKTPIIIIYHLQIIYYYLRHAESKILKNHFFNRFFLSFQTWFFTDTDAEDFQQRLNGHLINTKCPKGHSRRALCCKMAAELNTFLEHRKKWVSETVELLIYGRCWIVRRMWHALRFNFQ